MKFFKIIVHLLIPSLFLLASFQNCSGGSSQYSSQMAGESKSFVAAMLSDAELINKGIALYSSKCAVCHSQIAQTTVPDPTEARIKNAMSTVAAMISLKGQFSDQDILALSKALQPATLPATPPPVTGGVLPPVVVPPPPVTVNNEVSDFVCSSANDKKNSSLKQRRLTGEELLNTYASIFSSTIMSSIPAAILSKLPSDSYGSQVSNSFNNLFTPDQLDGITQLNESISLKLVADVNVLRTFFGTCSSLTSMTKACFTTFMTSMGPRILRSAITQAEIDSYYLQFAAIADVKQAYQLIVHLLFIDPRFLHHMEIGLANADTQGILTLSSFEVANKISYGMTSRPPDATLLAAAQANQLSTLAQVSAQVDRLALTEAFKLKTISMMRYYLAVAEPNIFQATTFLEGINPNGLVSAASAEFDQYIRYTVFDQRGSFKDLLTSDAVFPAQTELAKVMQSSVWTAGSAPNRSANYAGLLSRPILNMGASQNVSIILRGVKLRKYFLCDVLAFPANSNADALSSITEADFINLTNRMRIDKLTSNAACMSCHQNINRLGALTTNYDQLGRYVTVEKSYNSSLAFVANHAVNSQAVAAITPLNTTSYSGLLDFSNAAALHPKIQQCLAKRSFQFFNLANENVALDSCRLKEVTDLLNNQQPIVSVISQLFKSESILYKKIN